jgi:lipopolysaccharide/colanic/teichoic acid biosynthesis glycosyltransferase/GT2 family glycosyltransferase
VTPSISVIIPAYNAAETLPGCLAALRAQTLPPAAFEVLVVDDGSTDATVALAQAAGVQVHPAAHAGPAAARNLGAQFAVGDLLAFTDADCEPAPDWLARLTRPFDDPAVVGVKGTYRTRQQGLVARFVQQEYQDKYDRMLSREWIDFIDTYSAAYRRAVFIKNKGFETAFPTASVEDQELSFRLSEKGYRLKFAPDAIVYHRHDRSVAEYVRRKFWIGYWKAYLLRWHPEKALGDSHTPLAQRAQIVLLALASALGVLGLLWPPVGWTGLLGAGAFAASAVPLLAKIARRDPLVLWVAPLLLLVRAAALGAGLAAGAARQRRQRAPRQAVAPWPVDLLKRLLDVGLAAAGLLLALPLMLAAAVVIKLDSPGPVLFLQTRVGQHGRPFRMVKLRTMVQNAEQLLEQPAGTPGRPSGLPKAPGDTRITRAGRWLRRWSIDELPQLWNVLRGEMSLVGPRPEEPRIVALYTDWHRRRLAVKPGLTGPMQVNGRGSLPLDERVRLELDYIDHYSLRRDLALLLQSVSAVLTGRGAY